MRRWVCGDPPERFWALEACEERALVWRHGAEGEVGERVVEEFETPSRMWKAYAARVQELRFERGWREVIVPRRATSTEPLGPAPEAPSAKTHLKVEQRWSAGEGGGPQSVHYVARETGRRDGVYRAFHPSGAQRSVQVFRDGRLETVLRAEGPDGVPWERGDVEGGSGWFVERWASGAVRAEGAIVDGLRDGRWVFGYRSGGLQRSGTFAGGVQVGVWYTYRREGTLSRVERFSDDGRSVQVQALDDDGRLMREGAARVGAGGALDPLGIWRTWDDRGKITEVTHHQGDGEAYVEAWRDGVKVREGRFVPGVFGPVRDGVCTEYTLTGKVKGSMRYDLGARMVAPRLDAKRVRKAIDAHPGDARAQVDAMVRAYRNDVPTLLATVEQAVRSGKLTLTAEQTVELASRVWEQQLEIAPRLMRALPQQAAQAALEGAVARLMQQPYPDSTRGAALVLCLDAVAPEVLASEACDGLWRRVLGAWTEVYDARRAVVARLRDALRRLTLAQREALVLQPYGPLWGFVAVCPTPAVMEACLTRVVGLKRGAFTYAVHRRATMLEAMEAWGDAALEPLMRTLAGERGARAPQRELLVVALGKLERPEAGPTLVALLDDGQAAVRTAAVEGLVRLGWPQARVWLEEALASGRKRVRLGGAKALAALPRSEEVDQARRDQHDATRDAQVRRVLDAALAETPPDPDAQALEAMRASVTLGMRDALRERFTQIEPDDVRVLARELAWREPVTLVMFIDACLRALEGISAQPEAFWARLEGGCTGGRGKPGVATAVAELLVALPDKGSHRIEDVLERTAELLGSAALAGPLARVVARTWPPTRGRLVAWLASHHPRESVVALVRALSDTSAPVARAGVEGLTRAGADVLPEVWPALRGAARERDAAIDVLAAIPDARSVPHLEEALERERSAKRSEALRSALALCRGEVPSEADVSAGAEVDIEALDAALARRAPSEAPLRLDPPLPEVRWRGGAPLSEGAVRWLLGALEGEGPNTRNAELWRVRGLLDDASAAAFSRGIVQRVVTDARRVWGLYQRAVLGDDADMHSIGHELQAMVHTRSPRWASHALTVLERNPTPSALRWIGHWATHARTDKLLRDARAALDRLARDAETSHAVLLDRATPTLGFDPERRTQRWPLGPELPDAEVILSGVRTLDVRVGDAKALGGWPSFEGDALPEARAAEARLDKLVPKLRGWVAHLTRRLEAAMLTERRWDAKAWRAWWCGHPLMQGFAEGLVFWLPSADVLVHWSSETGLSDVRGAPVELAEDDAVQIAHPARVSGLDGLRASWAGARRGRPPAPFAQLTRAVPEGEPRDAIEALRKAGTFAWPQLHDALARRGYSSGDAADGMIYEEIRPIDPDWSIRISHSGYVAATRRGVDASPAQIEACYPMHRDPRITQAPAALWAEAWNDLRVIMASATS